VAVNRALARVAVGVALCAATAAVLTLAVGTDHPGPRQAPWSDAQLAAALTPLARGIHETIAPAEIAGILVGDCPYVDDPIGLVQQHMADTEAEANAVESVLARSGRCEVTGG
jgi:hypothetical protein